MPEALLCFYEFMKAETAMGVCKDDVSDDGRGAELEKWCLGFVLQHPEGWGARHEATFLEFMAYKGLVRSAAEGMAALAEAVAAVRRGGAVAYVCVGSECTKANSRVPHTAVRNLEALTERGCAIVYTQCQGRCASAPTIQVGG